MFAKVNLNAGLAVSKTKVESDVAVACAALMEHASGPLIGATILHAPEGVTAQLETRDTVFPSNENQWYWKRSRGSSGEQYENLLEVFKKGPDSLASLAVLGGCAMGGSGYGILLALQGWSLTFMIAIGGGASALSLLRRWYVRNPIRLTREHCLALVTSVDEGGWSVHASYDTDPKREASPEAGMLILARSMINDIRTSRAWNSVAMEGNLTRPDLDRELAEIQSATRALWQKGHTCDTATLTTDEFAGSLVGTSPQRGEDHATLRASIVERLEALDRYRGGLILVDALLATREITQQMQKRFVGIDDTPVHVSLGAAAVAELDTASSELSDVRANLTAQNDFLGISSR